MKLFLPLLIVLFCTIFALSSDAERGGRRRSGGRGGHSGRDGRGSGRGRGVGAGRGYSNGWGSGGGRGFSGGRGFGRDRDLGGGRGFNNGWDIGGGRRYRGGRGFGGDRGLGGAGGSNGGSNGFDGAGTDSGMDGGWNGILGGAGNGNPTAGKDLPVALPEEVSDTDSLAATLDDNNEFALDLMPVTRILCSLWIQKFFQFDIHEQDESVRKNPLAFKNDLPLANACVHCSFLGCGSLSAFAETALNDKEKRLEDSPFRFLFVGPDRPSSRQVSDRLRKKPSSAKVNLENLYHPGSIRLLFNIRQGAYFTCMQISQNINKKQSSLFLVSHISLILHNFHIDEVFLSEPTLTQIISFRNNQLVNNRICTSPSKHDQKRDSLHEIESVQQDSIHREDNDFSGHDHQEKHQKNGSMVLGHEHEYVSYYGNVKQDELHHRENASSEKRGSIADERERHEIEVSNEHDPLHHRESASTEKFGMVTEREYYEHEVLGEHDSRQHSRPGHHRDSASLEKRGSITVEHERFESEGPNQHDQFHHRGSASAEKRGIMVMEHEHHEHDPGEQDNHEHSHGNREGNASSEKRESMSVEQGRPDSELPSQQDQFHHRGSPNTQKRASMTLEHEHSEDDVSDKRSSIPHDAVHQRGSVASEKRASIESADVGHYPESESHAHQKRFNMQQELSVDESSAREISISRGETTTGVEFLEGRNFGIATSTGLGPPEEEHELIKQEADDFDDERYKNLLI
uniref:Uncharacterized protein n=1 Tax=Romanomermis culicivorax TaxID=13658 RepID=A0A915JDB2_ROMCU